MLDRNRDRPPKDTSEEEIEEWNASAVIIPVSIPVMGHTCECGSRFQLPGQGVQGFRLRGAFTGQNIGLNGIMKRPTHVIPVCAFWFAWDLRDL